MSSFGLEHDVPLVFASGGLLWVSWHDTLSPQGVQIRREQCKKAACFGRLHAIGVGSQTRALRSSKLLLTTVIELNAMANAASTG
jgi:hypothetical protein